MVFTCKCSGACVQWRWARAHGSIDITGEGGALAARKSGGGGFAPYKSAVCGVVLQAKGEAYAEFSINSRNALVGVARAGFDVTKSAPKGLYHTANAWMYWCGPGWHCHNRDNSKPWASGNRQGIQEGGTVGLLLKQGSLHVYIKGKQVGTLVTGLTGQLVWAADLREGASVRIARKPVPA